MTRASHGRRRLWSRIEIDAKQAPAKSTAARTAGERFEPMIIRGSISATGRTVTGPDAHWLRAAALSLALLCSFPVASGLAQPADIKPYDDKLNRLAEVLGAVHYLRELCGATDGQLWRDRMRDILDGESTTALRRAKLTRSFNSGYRSYSRTYQTCTPTAQTAISRFLAEGVQIADGLTKAVP